MQRRDFLGFPPSPSSLVTSVESLESLVNRSSPAPRYPGSDVAPSTTGLASSRIRALCSILWCIRMHPLTGQAGSESDGQGCVSTTGMASPALTVRGCELPLCGLLPQVFRHPVSFGSFLPFLRKGLPESLGIRFCSLQSSYLEPTVPPLVRRLSVSMSS
jgi:hypothetical protein